MLTALLPARVLPFITIALSTHITLFPLYYWDIIMLPALQACKFSPVSADCSATIYSVSSPLQEGMYYYHHQAGHYIPITCSPAYQATVLLLPHYLPVVFRSALCIFLVGSHFRLIP